LGYELVPIQEKPAAYDEFLGSPSLCEQSAAEQREEKRFIQQPVLQLIFIHLKSDARPLRFSDVH
jgi:hypothetical protein